MITNSPITQDIDRMLSSLENLSAKIESDVVNNPSLHKNAVIVATSIQTLSVALVEAQADIISGEKGAINRLVHYDHLLHVGGCFIDNANSILLPTEERSNGH